MPVSSAVDGMPQTVFEAKGGTYKYREPSKWAKHQFTCFDGEGFDIDGRHQYVYLCAYDGTEYQDVRNDNGLSTEQCFQFLVNVAAKHKYGINVIYGGSYDSNMMLRDVPEPQLRELHETGSTRWRDWRISFIPRKEFTVVHIPTARRNSCRLWDVIGFFQCSFVSAIESWLNVKDKEITRGKKARSAFRAGQIDWIISYCQRELYLFEQLMQRLWVALDNIGVKLNRWDGAGAIAQCLLQQSGVKAYMGDIECNEEYYLFARCAYAGGRFELIAPGDYRCKVYNYDINSAYPAAMIQLPEFNGLRACSKKNCTIGQYDLVKVDYTGDVSTKFHPYFHRHQDYSVSYPLRTQGWHWGIEYLSAGDNCGTILQHLHWRDSGVRPFLWVTALYAKRKALKDAGDKAEIACKLGYNSFYGKMVQQRGWKPGKKKPQFHQLYMGGWVTAYTRSKIYEAMCMMPDSVIAVETDGIFTTAELPLETGSGLGQWEIKEYDSLTYVQSGMYFGTLSEGYYKGGNREVAKYRGLDKGSLTREAVIKAWTAYEDGGKGTVTAKSTRFRTLGTSLVGARLGDWRQWSVDKKEVSLVAGGKRLHSPGCDAPWGYGTHHDTIAVQPQILESRPYNVLWADTESRMDLYNELEEDWETFIYEN